jgi:hypothetical protein
LVVKSGVAILESFIIFIFTKLLFTSGRNIFRQIAHRRGLVISRILEIIKRVIHMAELRFGPLRLVRIVVFLVQRKTSFKIFDVLFKICLYSKPLNHGKKGSGDLIFILIYKI